MAAPATDALGISAYRIALNAKLTSIGTAITNWTGDSNGLKDLKIIQGQISDTLNLSSTAVGTAYSGFGIGAVST
jgi:hypothetical protein